jgi:hypothetical protein
MDSTMHWAETLRVALEAALPPAAYTTAWEHGKSLDLDRVVDELMSISD